jgi:epoxide hydrolase 4
MQGHHESAPSARFLSALSILLTLLTCLAEAVTRPCFGQDVKPAPLASTLLPGAQDGFANSNGVKIHYVSLGRVQEPLIVLVHGFPDFWFSWRAQMPALAKRFHVVAIDQRGYNLSDKPVGLESYTVDRLVGDVVAVVRHFQRDKAVIVGHDWGGLVAWNFAMKHPEMTDRLIVLNLPHPRGLLREMATNPRQQQNSQYARDFQKPDAAKHVEVGSLVAWVKDPEARKVYREALGRSSMEGILNYYKANYPSNAAEAKSRARQAETAPSVQCPVMLIHGLKDTALLQAALNDTWNWVEKDLTLVTIPGAGHFVQQDAHDLVTRSMVSWLSR